MRVPWELIPKSYPNGVNFIFPLSTVEPLSLLLISIINPYDTIEAGVTPLYVKLILLLITIIVTGIIARLKSSYTGGRLP